MITISAEQMIIVENFQSLLTLAGIIINVNESNRANKRIQIRQFPALLREQDVSASFISLIDELSMTKLSPIKGTSENDENEASLMISAIAKVMSAQNYSEEQANNLWLTAEKLFGSQLLALLLLNSVPLDLTSDIKQLTAKIEPQYPEG
ncbi:hypothetical protein L3081_23465 [Colwellia sp. MSW7]|uniref:Uncharacterized protein n=2 Tax=Colwellia maritima TaxID=2912588 RepID=A0ABS9X6E7_9GAMM|nr:hypothetical protein [Colwellia maritima]